MGPFRFVSAAFHRRVFLHDTTESGYLTDFPNNVNGDKFHQIMMRTKKFNQKQTFRMHVANSPR